MNQGWQQDFEDFTRCEPSAYRRELLENLDTLEAVIHRVVNTYGVLRMKENELNALKENGSQMHDEITSMSHQNKDTSSSSGNYTTQAVDADIGPVNDEEPFAEVQLTALHNILANEQQHTEQSEPSYDTHLLETIDSNTTPTSTNMCHRGGEIDQDALLKTELLKTKDMVDKEIYNELSKRFLQLEKHCISLEIQIQQKEESFQSNKPCKNQEFPEFREFFVINDLKAQLLARTTLICNLKKQIKSVKETSNEAKVKNNIDVIETINIELEHITPHYLPKVRESAAVKPHQRNAIKWTQDKTRIPVIRILAFLLKHTALLMLIHQDQKHIIVVSPILSASGGMSNVNSRAKVQSPKIRNNNPVEPKNHTHKPGRRNGGNQRRIFKTVSLGGYLLERCTIIAQPKLSELQMVQMMISLTHMNAIKLFMLVQRSLLHDNIIPKPDLALELGKSISLTEAEEEAVAREVHATHARIVSGPDPEPMQEDQTRSNSGKLHVSLAGPNPEHMDDELTEAEEEAVAREVHATHARIVSGPDLEPMQEDQTGSNSGKLHVSLAGPNPKHMDDEFLATAYPKVHENLKLITDERVIEENPESHSGSMSSMKNLDDTYNFGDQFLYDKLTEDDQEKSKVIEESDSTIPDPSHQTVTSTPPVIAPFTDVSSTKPSSLVTPPPINTEATTIITSLPEITPFISLQLRVARLEQDNV
ncbi:hypothetical protein Tco_0426196 [Tanacetum coccineum]